MQNRYAAVVLLVVTVLSMTATPADDFRYSKRAYLYTENLFEAIWEEFHLREPLEVGDQSATVANWDDIDQICQADFAACDRLADLLTLRYPMLFKGNSGRCRTYKNEGHYFIAQRDDIPPEGYAAIDRIDSHDIWLLCGLGFYGEAGYYPILVRVRDNETASVTVAPDLSLYMRKVELYGPSQRRGIEARLNFYGLGPQGQLLWSLEEFGDID